MKILVTSCDKNEDIYEAFHYCMEKNWKGHPEVIFATETIKNPYYKTICKDYPLNLWTRRIRETLDEINDDKILIINDDCFITEPVDKKRLKYIEKCLSGNMAAVNMETSWDENDEETEFEGILKRQRGSSYELSLLCGLWQKDKLIKILEDDSDPWTPEWKQNTKGFDFYINGGKDIINWGSKPFKPMGLVKGKWTRNIIPFFEKEGIKIDYEKRGFAN